jgi:PBSX family phage portal protein
MALIRRDAQDNRKSVSQTIPVEDVNGNKHVLKATVVSISKSFDQSNLMQEDEYDAVGLQARVVRAPLNQRELAVLQEVSSELGQTIESMTIGIEGFGARLVERQMPKELKAKHQDEIDEEQAWLQSFMEFPNHKGNLIKMRKETRQQLEATGNAYWELVPSRKGDRYAAIELVPAGTMWICRQDARFTTATVKYLAKDLEIKQKKFNVKFRRYVQIVNGKQVWFKEFGDPRKIDRRNGEEVPAEALKKFDPDFLANEIVHFKIPTARNTPYGMPRHTGNIIAIKGSRSADETNIITQQNNHVPSMAILVSGGMLTEGSIQRIQQFVDTAIRGSSNYSKFLILEGEGARDSLSGASSMKIEIKPLSEVQQKDQLWQEYDKNNASKIRRSFRLAPILVGSSDNYDRACYSEDTETLTERGWRKYWQIDTDEKIATFNPRTGLIEYQKPVGGIYLYDYKGEMIRFQSQHVDILVTPEHKMWVANHNAGPLRWRKVQAKDFETAVAQRFIFKCAGILKNGVAPEHKEIPGYTLDRGPNAGTIPAIQIPMDLWVEFVSAFVADGCTNSSIRQCFVRLSAKKERKIVQFREIFRKLKLLGFNVHDEWLGADGMSHFALTHKMLWIELRKVCGAKANKKRLPRQFLHLPKKLLRLCLNTLQNTDGTTDSRVGRESWAYSTTSKWLANQIQIIGTHLNMRVLCSVLYEETELRSRCYRLSLNPRSEIQIYQSQITRERYNGKVYCFEVPNHLFVTRRNGKVTIQGNTAVVSEMLTEKYVFNPEREDVDAIINRILVQQGIRFWRFKSNSPNVTNTEELVKVLTGAEKSGGLTPRISRMILEDILNRELPSVDEMPKEFNPDLPFSYSIAKMAYEPAKSNMDGKFSEQGQLPAPKGKPGRPPKDEEEEQTEAEKVLAHAVDPKKLVETFFSDPEMALNALVHLRDSLGESLDRDAHGE